jgi:transposase
VKKHGEVYIEIDTAKARNAVAVAESGRDGEISYLGEFPNTPDAVAKLIRKLADRYETLHVCYEGGPTGYGLYRQICTALGCWDWSWPGLVEPSTLPSEASRMAKTRPSYPLNSSAKWSSWFALVAISMIWRGSSNQARK